MSKKTSKAERNLEYRRDDSLFPNINETVFNKRQALEAMKDTALEFGNKLWQYLPVAGRKFQNPETGDTFTIEEIYQNEIENPF